MAAAPIRRYSFVQGHMRSNSPISENSAPGRFVACVFGFVFFGIGLTVLGFLWLTPFDQFGSPPLFFRIFGSFISIAFVAMGGALAWSAFVGKPLSISPTNLPAGARPHLSIAPSQDSYVCPRCAAPLQSDADVSPLGDVKCPFCHSWFNIHKPTS